MKKIVIFVLIVLIIGAAAYVAYNNLNKDENISNQDIVAADNNYFEELIQYKAESINNEENLNKIVKNIEFGEYLVNIEKTFEGEKEYITINYDCTDEEKVKQYFKECQDFKLLEKNNVILFALVDKLEKISYKFTISDLELVDKYSLPTRSDGSLVIGYPALTRENIECYYNQDVRNYVENPTEFLKYKIDLNTDNVTIYKLEINSEENNVTTIDIKDRKQINNIIKYIENENFGVNIGGLNSICTTWVDLNNGYIIGLLGTFQSQDYGIIIKGNGQEIFKDEEAFVKAKEMSSRVYKILPKGLTEYIEEVIQNSMS